MAKIIRARVLNAQAYTVDQARRQLNRVHEKFQILARAQQATTGNRITASAFAQNSIRELLEFTAPVVVPITAARILAVGVKKKDGTKTSKNSDDKIAKPKAPKATDETPEEKAEREAAEAKSKKQNEALKDMESAFGRPTVVPSSSSLPSSRAKSKDSKIYHVAEKMGALYKYVSNEMETEDGNEDDRPFSYHRGQVLLLLRDLNLAELASGSKAEQLQEHQHKLIKEVQSINSESPTRLGKLERTLHNGLASLHTAVEKIASIDIPYIAYTGPKNSATQLPPAKEATKSTPKPSAPKPSAPKVVDDPKTKAVEVSALKLYSAYAAIMALEPGVVEDIADFAGLAKEYWDALAKMFAKVPELAKLAKSGQKESADTDGAPEDYMQAVQIAIDDFKSALAKAEKAGKVSVKQDIDAASIPSHAKLVSQIEKFQRRYGDAAPLPEEADELKAQIKEMTTALSTAVGSVPEEAGIKSTVEKTIKEAQKFANSKKQPSDEDMVKMVDNMVMVVNLLSQVSSELAERAQEIAGGSSAAVEEESYGGLPIDVKFTVPAHEIKYREHVANAIHSLNSAKTTKPLEEEEHRHLSGLVQNALKPIRKFIETKVPESFSTGDESQAEIKFLKKVTSDAAQATDKVRSYLNSIASRYPHLDRIANLMESDALWVGSTGEGEDKERLGRGNDAAKALYLFSAVDYIFGLDLDRDSSDFTRVFPSRLPFANKKNLPKTSAYKSFDEWKASSYKFSGSSSNTETNKDEDLGAIAKEAYDSQKSIQAIASGKAKLTVSKVKNLVKTHFDKLLSLIPSIRALTDKFNSELDSNPAMNDKELRALIEASAEAMEVYISDVEDGNIDLEDTPEEDTPEDDVTDEAAQDLGSAEDDEEGEIGDTSPAPVAKPKTNTKPTPKATDDWDDPTAAPAQVAEEDEEGEIGDTSPTPVVTPKTNTKPTPKEVADWDDPAPAGEETPVAAPDNTETPVPEEEEGYDATNAIKEAENQPEPVAPEDLAPTTPVITPTTPGGNTFQELDTTGKGGRVRTTDDVGKVDIPQVKITLDPQTKKEIARHRAIAADLTALFHELQSINSRVMSSLAQSVDDKQLKQIREFISRLGLQVRASLLNSMIAVREMTAAHIPQQYAATASNLYSLITKTIPTERKVTAHTFMFMYEDELCFTTYYPLLRPQDARGKTLPRLFVYLTFRTDAHKMYVCTSTEMMALSEDLFRAPFSNAKNMKLALDRLLTLENFHSNLSKVNLATVFGKGGKDAESPVQMLERMSVNGFLPISGIAQDGDELVISLSPDIKEGQEQQVEIAYNKLQNILKTRLGKSYRIYMTYDYVNTDIDTELPVYNDLDDNEQTKPQDFTAVPHYEIRLSFKQVPGQEDITEAQLSFLKDRFMKLSDEAIRKMVRVANDS